MIQLQTYIKARLRTGPRLLCVALLCFSIAPLLSGCGWTYGPGLTQLHASDGWYPLPVQRWLTSSGVETTAMLICRADVCGSPSVAILMEADWAAARQLDAALASNKALTERKARTERKLRTMQKARALPGRPGVKHRAGPVPEVIRPRQEAISHIERFMHQGNPALRIAMEPKSGSGRSAYAVVLSQAVATGRRYALAVTTDPQLALNQAEAILASVPYGG
jgi:hypothetical protein